MNKLPYHHGAGPPEARGQKQPHRLHWLKIGPGKSKHEASQTYAPRLTFLSLAQIDKPCHERK